MTHIEVRTTDSRFPEGRDGRRIVQGTEHSRRTTGTGAVVVTFELTPDQIPTEWLSKSAMAAARRDFKRAGRMFATYVPAEWVL